MSCDITPIVNGKESAIFNQIEARYGRDRALEEFSKDYEFSHISNDGVLFSPTENMSNRVERSKSFIKRNKREQIKLLKKRKFQLEKDLEDIVDVQEIARVKRYIDAFSNEVERIESNIKSIDKKFTINFLVTEAQADMDVVEKYLDVDELSPLYQRYIQQMISFWTPVINSEKNDLISKKDYENHSEIFDDLIIRMNRAEKKLEDFNYAETIKFAKSQGADIAREELEEAVEDIGFFKKYFLDIGAVDDSLIQVISNAIKKTNKAARVGVEKVFRKIEDLTASMRKSADNEDFFQLDDNGDFTGRIIHRFSNKYFNDRGSAIFKQNNEILIDMRRLINDSDDSIDSDLTEGGKYDQEYADYLKSELGERTFEKYMEITRKKYEKYKMSRLNAYNTYSKSEYKAWIYKHSPFAIAERWEEHNQKDLAPAFVHNFDHIDFVPKRYNEDGSETGYYDQRFDKIEDNKDLYEYHEYVTKSLYEFNFMLPYHMRTKHPGYDIPYIRAGLFSSFKGFSHRLASKDKGDLIKFLFTEHRDRVEVGTDIDYNTGKKRRKFKLHGSVSIPAMIEFETEQRLKDEAYSQGLDNIKLLSYKETKEIKDSVKKEILSTMETDISLSLKTLAMSANMHKNKQAIEDQLLIAESVFRKKKAFIKNKQGRIIKTGGKKESRDYPEEIRKVLDQYMSVSFYGEGIRETEGAFGSKIYGKEEKKQLEQIEKRIEQAEEQLESGEITQSEYNDLVTKLLSQKEDLGGTLAVSKIVDQVMKLFQLVVMGFNIAAGVANVAFGQLGNFVLIDERLYTSADMFRAYRNMTLHPMKTYHLSKKYDVLKKTSEELHAKEGSFSRTGIGKLIKSVLSPYMPMDLTESINQTPVMISFMLNEYLVDENGERSNLWNAYDSEGILKPRFRTKKNIENYEELAPNSKGIKMATTMDEWNSFIHGNYDPDRPILAKATTLGRMFSMFRTWAFNGFRVRFDKEKYNAALGMKTKGRWRTGIGLATWKINDENNNPITASEKDIYGAFGRKGRELELKPIHLTLFQGRQFLLSLIGRKRKADNYLSLKEAGVEEVDIQNMQQNLRELALYITYSLATLALAKDEDDEENQMYNFLFNMGLRVKSDILFYISPGALMKVINEPIALLTLYQDLEKWFDDLYETTFGDKDATLQGGPFKDWNRNVVNTMEIMPVSSQFTKMWRLTDDQIEN